MTTPVNNRRHQCDRSSDKTSTNYDIYTTTTTTTASATGRTTTTTTTTVPAQNPKL